jgi:hypothetical protein
MLPNHLCRLILFALLSFIPIASQAADKRGITEKDLFDFVWIGDPQISPDGSRVAFVRVSVNEKKIGYDTAIWAVSTVVAGWKVPRLYEGDRERRQTRAAAAGHAGDGWG